MKFSESSTHSDEWVNNVPRPKPGLWNERVCTGNTLKVEDGINQEEIIKKFQDYFLTTLNKLCPVDSKEDKRNTITLFNFATAHVLHPCSSDLNSYFENDNGFTSVRNNAELYQPAVNVVERNNCNGYCFR